MTTHQKGPPKLIHLCHHDLPAGYAGGDVAAIDTETMGLVTRRDRLCLVQIRFENSDTYLIKRNPDSPPAPHLKKVLADPKVTKLFHFARFDLAALYHAFGVMAAPVYCTKVASKLVRTYTDRHGLKELCRELLGRDLSKTEQTSDWGKDTLTEAQKTYAAQDVLYLHDLKRTLDKLLIREKRDSLAQKCFDFLPARVMMDLLGWDESILQH